MKAAISKLKAQKHALFTDPGKGKTVSWQEMRDLLISNLGTANFQLLAEDNEYLLIDKEVMKEILKHDGTDAYAYRKEGFDCDNFAVVLVGRIYELAALHGVKRQPAVGVIVGWIVKEEGKPAVNHAMNVVVTSGREVWLVEPQTDEWFRPNKKSAYRWVMI